MLLGERDIMCLMMYRVDFCLIFVYICADSRLKMLLSVKIEGMVCLKCSSSKIYIMRYMLLLFFSVLTLTVGAQDTFTAKLDTFSEGLRGKAVVIDCAV